MTLVGQKKIVLDKIFSREKTLFWFLMWNDSDRRGWNNFLNYEIKNNLFLVLPVGQKSSVWYNQEELEEMSELLRAKLKEDSQLKDRLVKTWEDNWPIILPYLKDQKKIKSVTEFLYYYDHLVDWWSAMTVVFEVPEISLGYRTRAEKYTEKMNKIFVDFWQENFFDQADLFSWVAPKEIANPDWELIEKRKQGCFMLNEKIYPLVELDKVLLENNLELAENKAEEVREIKGQPAYAGKIKGRVRKILSFSQMSNFQPGEVLVTEMTNPDYLPIMKKAAAIVTDEGGVTCHAAIASREIKVPCVVGAKIATKLLQDGDEVEVDAENGIIKKL